MNLRRDHSHSYGLAWRGPLGALLLAIGVRDHRDTVKHAVNCGESDVTRRDRYVRNAEVLRQSALVVAGAVLNGGDLCIFGPALL